MTIDSLIADGIKVKTTCLKHADGTIPYDYFSGQEFETWVAKGIAYMQENHDGKEITKRFIEKSKSKKVEDYETMMGCLYAAKEVEEDNKNNGVYY